MLKAVANWYSIADTQVIEEWLARKWQELLGNQFSACAILSEINWRWSPAGDSILIWVVGMIGQVILLD